MRWAGEHSSNPGAGRQPAGTGRQSASLLCTLSMGVSTANWQCFHDSLQTFCQIPVLRYARKWEAETKRRGSSFKGTETQCSGVLLTETYEDPKCGNQPSESQPLPLALFFHTSPPVCGKIA